MCHRFKSGPNASSVAQLVEQCVSQDTCSGLLAQHEGKGFGRMPVELHACHAGAVGSSPTAALRCRVVQR